MSGSATQCFPTVPPRFFVGRRASALPFRGIGTKLARDPHLPERTEAIELPGITIQAMAREVGHGLPGNAVYVPSTGFASDGR
jgi:hypothetical protein